MASIVGSASAAGTSCPIPAHQAGDTIILAARGATTFVTSPSQGGTVPLWIPLQGGGANSLYLNVSYALATAAGDTTSGVWANATHIVVLVLRPVPGERLDLGQSFSSVGNGNNTATIVYPALTLQKLDGTSWGVRIGTRGTAAAPVATPPGSWTNQVVQPASPNGLIALHTRSGLVANPGTDSVSSMGNNAAYRAVTVEVQVALVPVKVPVTGVDSPSAFGTITGNVGPPPPPQTVQVGSVYPPGCAPSITGQVVCGDGHLVGGTITSQFGQVTVSVRTAGYPGGVPSAQSFGLVTVKTTVSQSVAGVGSAQQFGALAFKTTVTTAIPGLASEQAFGAVVAKGTSTRAVAGIPSAQAFSTVSIKIGTVTSPNAGVPSAAAFGTLRFWLKTPILGVPSAQQFGTPKLNVKYQLSVSVPTAQQFGAIVTRTGFSVVVGGVGSAQAFGTIRPAYVTRVAGVGSAQWFGLVTLGVISRVQVEGVPSAQAFGVPVGVLTWIRPIPCEEIALDPIECLTGEIITTGSICGEVICGDGHLCGGTSTGRIFITPAPAPEDLPLVAAAVLDLDLGSDVETVLELEPLVCK